MKRILTKLSALTIFLVSSMLLSACGVESNSPQIETREIQTDNTEALQDLQAELYALQAEIEEARLQLELQNELVQIDYENETDHADHEEVEAVQAHFQLVPHQQELGEILLGEWFCQDFQGILQSWVFNSNGLLYQINSHYVYHQPNDTHQFGDPNFPTVQQMAGQWDIINGTPYRIISANRIEIMLADNYEYFQVLWASGNSQTFRRTPPDMPSQFGGQWLPMAQVMNQVEIANAARMRRFLGQWHLDASLWTFNEDGTGVIYSPAMGMHPASHRYFTFEVFPVTLSDYDATLLMNFEYFEDDEIGIGGRSFMYHVRFGTRSGGSIEFGDSFLLTRMFDINNTPFFDHQLETFMGIMDMIGNFVP